MSVILFLHLRILRVFLVGFSEKNTIDKRFVLFIVAGCNISQYYCFSFILKDCIDDITKSRRKAPCFSYGDIRRIENF